MKKQTLVYVVSHERLNPRNEYSRLGIAIREKKSGALNRFFFSLLTDDGDREYLPVELLEHLQELVNLYGAKIEWDMNIPN